MKLNHSVYNMIDTIRQEFAPKPKDGEPWDVIIIGSGPSGLTAAIYTTRGAASTLVLAGDKWGGQLMLTTEVDNFPGFPEGIQGPELMSKIRAQAERFGAEIIERNVLEVNLNGEIKKVRTSDHEYSARSVIIATGADTRWLGVPGEDEFRGRGVSSCAPCDAPFFKDKEVVVVGGGDSAMEEALVLTKYATVVTVIHRRDELKASRAMQQRVFDAEKKGKVRILWDSEVKEMKGDSVLQSIVVSTKMGTDQAKKLTDGELDSLYKGTKISEDENLVWEMPVDGVFVAIGHVPSTGIFKDEIELDEKGYVKVYDHTKTSRDNGVFVAGDVHDYNYRQAITASGYGCMAGMDALKYLDKDGPSY